MLCGKVFCSKVCAVSVLHKVQPASLSLPTGGTCHFVGISRVIFLLWVVGPLDHT